MLLNVDLIFHWHPLRHQINGGVDFHFTINTIFGINLSEGYNFTHNVKRQISLPYTHPYSTDQL